MVPWLHCDNRKSAIEWREQYLHRAQKIMKSKWERYQRHEACIPLVGYPEKFIECLELDERCGDEVITFTKNGYYPDKYDVSKSLEELAVQVTCSSMGWPYPNNWQQERVRLLGCRNTEYDIFDLAGYDPTKKNLLQNIGNITTNAKEKEDSSDKKRMKYTPQPSNAATDAPLDIGKQKHDERKKENDTTAVASVGGEQQRRENNRAAYQEGGYYNRHPRAERRGEYNPAKYQPKEEDKIALPPLDGPLVSNDSLEEEKKEEEDEQQQYRYSTPQYNPAYDEASYYGYNNDDGGFNYGHDGDSFYE